MSALDKALQKWKTNPNKAQSQGVDDKSKKAKRESKPPAKNRKVIAKTNVKQEPIQDMRAHLRTHVLPKDSGIPLQKQVKDSLDALQKAQGAMSPEELEAITGFPCNEDTALAAQLAQNPKVTVVDGKYKYKAASDVLVSDKAGALEFIQKSHGCMLRDLRQVYANAEKDVEALKKDGRIWILPSSEKDQKIVYPREKPPMISVNESIGKAWLSIQMPEDLEEEARELKKASLTSAVKRERPKLQKKDKEKKKRAPNFSRFTKITNQHLPHLFQGEVGSID